MATSPIITISPSRKALATEVAARIAADALKMDIAIYDTDADGIVDGAESLPMLVRNNTGVTIPALSAVYVTGAIGQRPTITLAKGDAEATSSKTIAVTPVAIPNNTDAFVITMGRLHSINTSGLTEGSAIWLSATIAGALTNVRPAAPLHAVFMGFVVYSHPVNGIILVNIQNGYELHELHNVSPTVPASNLSLTYNTVTTLWEGVSKEDTGVAATLDANHVAAVDPHSQYSPFIVLAAGENLTAGTPVCIIANLFYAADNVTNFKVVGIITTTVTTGFSATARTYGKITLSALSTNSPYFLGNKILAVSAPVSGYVIRLGIALNTTELLINIEEPILLS